MILDESNLIMCENEVFGSLKNSRKVDKKHKRCQHNFERQTGVSTSTKPTKNIGVCNAGLSNGLSEETLTENFSRYGQLNNVMGVPGKSFCFVEFNNLKHATEAFEAINGKLNIAQGNKPLYLCYIEKIPEMYKITYNNSLPPGLILLNDFITELDEEELLSMHNFEETTSTSLKNRLVKHYGYEFCYDINNVKKDCPLDEGIPEILSYLWKRLEDRKGITFTPDQLTINYYRPGNGIPAHVDTHSAFEDPLVCLSLGSGIIMEFNRSASHLPVYLPARSLAVISGESRYAWTHKIVPRKLDVLPSEKGVVVLPRKTRTSFTFRKVRRNACDCGYPEMCDSQSSKKTELVSDEVASKLEEVHVHSVYDNIASHFSDTRHKPWPNVENFLKGFEVGSVLVDVGCGNGKYLNCNPTLFNLGCDRSSGLLEVCSSRGFEVFACNCLQIPLRDDSADCVICIAVIHHLATPERRVQALLEITRVMRIGGKALVYVWAKDQCRNDKSTYIKQDRKNRKEDVDVCSKIKEEVTVNGVTLPVHENRKQFQQQDMLVPWKNKHDSVQNVFLRYYHVFEEGELETLCSGIKGLKVIKSYYDQGNWCVVLEKYG